MMIRRDTAEHSHQKKLVEQREQGHEELMKENLRRQETLIQQYSDLHKRFKAKTTSNSYKGSWRHLSRPSRRTSMKLTDLEYY